MPPAPLHRHRRARNFALGGALFALAALFFAITIAKLSS